MSKDVLPILLISSMVLLLYIVRFIIITISHKEKYRFNIYKKKLDFKKLGKWYLYIQAFTLFCKPNGASWIVVLSTPPILIALIAICFFNNGNNDDSEIYKTDDYESYKKQVDRDKKIKDILR